MQMKEISQLAVLLLLATTLSTVTSDASDAECVTGEVRTWTGADSNDTFIRYCYMGEWSGLCAGVNQTTWTEQSSMVACRHLGYSDQGPESGTSCPESTTGNMVDLSQSCTGTEIRLQDCGIETTTCNCSEHTTLICQPACSNGVIRLVGGSSDNEGRVEVCVNGRWGTVCNRNQAEIIGAICLRLGFPAKGALVSFFQPGTFPTSNCRVEDESVLRCTQLTDASCSHSKDLGVVCRTCDELQNELQRECPIIDTTTTQQPLQPLLCEPDSTNECIVVIVPALGAVIGVLVALLFGTVTTLVITCGALKKSKGKKSTSNVLHQPVDLLYSRDSDLALNPAYNMRHEFQEMPEYETIEGRST